MKRIVGIDIIWIQNINTKRSAQRAKLSYLFIAQKKGKHRDDKPKQIDGRGLVD